MPQGQGRGRKMGQSVENRLKSVQFQNRKKMHIIITEMLSILLLLLIVHPCSLATVKMSKVNVSPKMSTPTPNKKMSTIITKNFSSTGSGTGNSTKMSPSTTPTPTPISSKTPQPQSYPIIYVDAPQSAPIQEMPSMDSEWFENMPREAPHGKGSMSTLYPVIYVDAPPPAPIQQINQLDTIWIWPAGTGPEIPENVQNSKFFRVEAPPPAPMQTLSPLATIMPEIVSRNTSLSIDLKSVNVEAPPPAPIQEISPLATIMPEIISRNTSWAMDLKSVNVEAPTPAAIQEIDPLDLEIPSNMSPNITLNEDIFQSMNSESVEAPKVPAFQNMDRSINSEMTIPISKTSSHPQRVLTEDIPSGTDPFRNGNVFSEYKIPAFQKMERSMSMNSEMTIPISKSSSHPQMVLVESSVADPFQNLLEEYTRNNTLVAAPNQNMSLSSLLNLPTPPVALVDIRTEITTTIGIGMTPRISTTSSPTDTDTNRTTGIQEVTTTETQGSTTTTTRPPCNNYIDDDKGIRFKGRGRSFNGIPYSPSNNNDNDTSTEGDNNTNISNSNNISTSTSRIYNDNDEDEDPDGFFLIAMSEDSPLNINSKAYNLHESNTKVIMSLSFIYTSAVYIHYS